MTKHYRSYSKINLGLEVLGRRSDGYHDINTLFYRLEHPGDELIVEDSENFEFAVPDKNTPSGASNLVRRAFEECATLRGTGLPNLRIELRKSVPVGAGLGGGSADAAKAIEIYSEIVALLSGKEKYEVARSLGADVPFFLMTSRAAVASGKGDILTPAAVLAPYGFVIVKPKGISISTAEAYQRITISKRSSATDLLLAAELPPKQWQYHIFNDFEAGAFQLHPSLAVLKQSLYDNGADFALMSGSGSAFFGVFSSRAAATAACEMLRNDPALDVFLNE